MNVSSRRARIILCALFILFASPGLIAYWVYSHPAWLQSRTTNRGEFISPPVTLVAPWVTSDKWHLILWSPVACSVDCLKKLDTLARVRLALGRRLYDVDVVLLQPASITPPSDHAVSLLMQKAIRISHLSLEDEKQVASLASQSSVWLMNPHRQLVMRYALDAPADDVFHDLKHLLSQGASQ